MTSSAPRTAVTARLLAAVLVPLIALPAMAGLVVCPGPDGPTTAWGQRPCPKRQAALPAVAPDDASAAPCVVLPDADPAPVLASPDLLAPSPLAQPGAPLGIPRPAEAPVALQSGPRGPPAGALRALRTVVLRV